MTINQIYQLVNDATKEVLGETAVVNEDLSNIVDIGDTIANANGIDAYVKALTNHIGRVIFVNRAYKVNVPSVLMDGWEFGSILEKISADLPDAQVNESWDLISGQSYDPNVFVAPSVSAKFYNKKITFEIQMSFTERQVKQSFADATQLNAFISMLYNEVEKSMTVKVDDLIMMTINSMIGDTFYDEFPGGTYSGATSVKAINLLEEYNTATGNSITVAECLADKDFIRFATKQIALASDRLTRLSKLFNIGGKARFTPKEMQTVVLLAEFEEASKVYLESDTYHKELVALPGHSVVPFWQGSGTAYAFSSTSAINVITAGNHTVTPSGILGVIFDRDAIAVCNQDRRVTTNYNPKAEFYNNWFKYDCSYLADPNENFVVFYVA